jgi:hypothetical protein
MHLFTYWLISKCYSRWQPGGLWAGKIGWMWFQVFRGWKLHDLRCWSEASERNNSNNSRDLCSISDYTELPEISLALPSNTADNTMGTEILILFFRIWGRMRGAGHVAQMGEKRKAYRILVGKPEGKKPLWRPRSRWVNNIKMNLREIGWDGMDWIDLAQDRDHCRAVVNTVINFRVP